MKSKARNVTKDKCDRCGSILLVTDKEAGEIVCQNCGFVIIEKIIADGPEWRAQTDKKSQARAGAPISLLRNDNLSTNIDISNRDSLGKPLSTSTKLTLNRIRVQDARSKYSGNKERNLRQALKELQIMTEKLTLPDSVSDNAAYIYRKTIDMNLARGRTINALVGASLYAACRNSKTPRTLRDIMKAGNIKYKNLTKTYRLLVKELELQMPVADSAQCVSRIASRAGVSEKIKRNAIDILKKAQSKKIASGKHPMGLAAAALYASAVHNGDKANQKDIAEAADISEVTLRNRLKGLQPVLHV